MKKSTLYLLLSVLVLCSSCRKEYGYYDYTRLNVNLDLKGVIRTCVENTEGDFVPTQDQCIRIQFFLYNAAGQLVNHQETSASSYQTTTDYRLERLESGDYTLIATTDVLERKEGSFFPTYWAFNGTSNLSTFTASGLDAMDSMGERMLSLTRTQFTIDGRRKAKSLYLDAMPATAMVCVTYFDIFHWDNNIVGNDPDYRIYSYFDVTYEHDMNEACYTGGGELCWSYRETTNNEYYILDRLYPDNISSLNISSLYSYHALLPGKYSFRGYGEYNFRGQTECYPDETRPSQQLNVQSGYQYYIDFDIKNWTIAFEQGGPTYLEAPATRATSGDVSSVAANAPQSVRALDIPVSHASRSKARR